jgi:hypothetical protein
MERAVVLGAQLRMLPHLYEPQRSPAGGNVSRAHDIGLMHFSGPMRRGCGVGAWVIVGAPGARSPGKAPGNRIAGRQVDRGAGGSTAAESGLELSHPALILISPPAVTHSA